jgi:hypothetical protein
MAWLQHEKSRRRKSVVALYNSPVSRALLAARMVTWKLFPADPSNVCLLAGPPDEIKK